MLLVAERGAIHASRVKLLTGITPSDVSGAARIGAWWVTQELRSATEAPLVAAVSHFHDQHPLAPGEDVAVVREMLAAHLARSGTTPDPGLVEAVLADLERRGEIVREGASLRRPTHQVATETSDDVHRLVQTVAAGEPTPPTVAELLATGVGRDTIVAALRAELLVRVSRELVMTPGFVTRGRETVEAAGASGITVSAFREALGTSRRFALPLLEHLDSRGITRREGDVRVARDIGAVDPPD